MSAAVWTLLAGFPSDAELEARLGKLDDDALAAVGTAVLELRSEFVDVLMVGGLADDASEDVLDDLAGMLLREGEQRYAEYQRSERALPRRETWSGARLKSIVPLISRVVRERLNKDLVQAPR